jgi:Protein of unknown function (DUF982)
LKLFGWHEKLDGIKSHFHPPVAGLRILTPVLLIEKQKGRQLKVVFWDRPIRAGGRFIFGPLAAQEFMTAHWSSIKDKHFTAASDAIMAALSGRGSPDVACEKFEKAVKSAAHV